MIVADIKRHMCAMTGDTSDRSLLYTNFATDYINWTIQLIFERLRKEGKDYAFFKGETTIDTSTEGTGGDYLLPVDFGEIADASATTSTSGIFAEYDFVNNRDFDRIVRANLFDRSVVSAWFNNTTQRWRVRFQTVEGITPSVYTVAYKKRPNKVADDQDPIPLFPADSGWEQVLIYGAAMHAYRFNQEDFTFDPRPEFERLLNERIEVMNSDTPDECVTIPLSEHDKYYKRLEMDRYGEGGGRW